MPTQGEQEAGLSDKLLREAARGNGDDGSECCYAPKWTCCDPKLLIEADAEIKRLRAWAQDEQRGRHKAEEDRMNARSEIERLQAELAGNDESWAHHLSEKYVPKAEIERLRAALEDTAYPLGEINDLISERDALRKRA